MKLKLPKINLKKKEKRIVINPGEVEIKESEEEHADEESKVEPKKKEKKKKEKKPKKEKKSKKKKEDTEASQEGESEQGEETTKKKNKKLIIIAIICVLVIVICAVLWFVLLRPKNEEKQPEEEVVVEEPVEEKVPEVTKALPHSNVVYNTDRWYDDSNWSYDSSYYTDFSEECNEESCLLRVSDSLNGSTFTFKMQKSALFESCGDYLCTSTSTEGQLSYVEITYPDGTVGGRYNAGEYKLKSLDVWTLVSNALYSDMKNGVTDFTTMCDTAKKEAIAIVEHNSELENNAYNEVIIYLRSCRYAGKYK